MKKIFSILFIATAVLTSCEGPQGPPGFDGLDGIDGADGLIGETFEETISFNQVNDYAVRISLNPNIEDGDVVLVFRLEGIDNGRNDWEPLPTATIFLDSGVDVLYRYNFTVGDIDILLESNDPDQVPADLASDQVFRFVIIPADFAQNTNINLLDFYEVKSALNLEF